PAPALRQMGVEPAIAQDIEADVGKQAAVAPADARVLAEEARELGVGRMIEPEDPLEQGLERPGETQALGSATNHCASPSRGSRRRQRWPSTTMRSSTSQRRAIG